MYAVKLIRPADDGASGVLDEFGGATPPDGPPVDETVTRFGLVLFRGANGRASGRRDDSGKAVEFGVLSAGSPDTVLDTANIEESKDDSAEDANPDVEWFLDWLGSTKTAYLRWEIAYDLAVCTNQSINQCTNHSINQCTNQPINQSINQDAIAAAWIPDL